MAKKQQEIAFLSEELAKGKGYIFIARLELYNQKAALIVETPIYERTDEDDAFISNFVLSIVKAKIPHNFIVQQVEKWVENQDQASTSRMPVLYLGLDGFLAEPLQTIKLNETALKAQIFEGKPVEVRTWVDTFKRMAKDNDWTKSTMIKYFPNFLAKTAADWFVTLCQPDICSSTK